jgi:FkbM family methyltransferase
MKLLALRLFLFIFSRPIFFKLFYNIQKIALVAMNRLSPSLLSVEETGEKIACKWIISKLSGNNLTIFDCGGNQGHYTKMLENVLEEKKISYNIHVFEPSTKAFETIKSVFAKNPAIQVHKIAVSDTNEKTRLYFMWEGAGGASLNDSASQAYLDKNESLSYEEVQCTRLDDFCAEKNIAKVDFIKLDIEGFELKALDGIRNMIAQNNIRFIQIEQGSASLSTKQFLFDFWQLMEEKYNFYIVLQQGLLKISHYNPNLECFWGATNFVLELKS